MTQFDFSGNIFISIQVPKDQDRPSHHRFIFDGMARVAGRNHHLTPEQLQLLIPELRPFVPLHSSDPKGVPERIGIKAWYHAAGVIAPGEPDADPAPRDICIERFAKVMRMGAETARYHLDRLQRMGQEFNDTGILRTEIQNLIEDHQPRWRREARDAISTLPPMLAKLRRTE